MAERHTYNWLVEHKDYPHEQWCLMWPFYRDKHGRAVVNIDGKRLFAYRVMCKMTNGESK